MLNLEHLFLYIVASQKKGFINGNNLKRNVVTYLPRLKRFSFNIRSITREWNQIDTSSNEAMQKTFKDFKDQQIVSCVNIFPEEEKAHCHVYSRPYTIRCYDDIANNFQGGLFPTVRDVSLYDELPFEHEFFLQITHSFPMMEKLTVTNQKPQRVKLCRKSIGDHEEMSIIKYPHLIDVSLYEAHEDYLEEFLDDTRTCLPNGICLHVTYNSLQRVTHNFTRKSTQANCRKVDYLFLYDDFEMNESLKDYFPLTEIA